MTRIDFYITSITDKTDYLKFACRLTEKAFRNKMNIYLQTVDAISMQTMDDLLWTFRPGSFLPHGTEDQAVQAPAQKPLNIIVGHSGQQPSAFVNKDNDLLINLTESITDNFSRFDRVAEVVLGDEASKAKSRERYKFYRDRGYPLHIHNV